LFVVADQPSNRRKQSGGGAGSVACQPWHRAGDGGQHTPYADGCNNERQRSRPGGPRPTVSAKALEPSPGLP